MHGEQRLRCFCDFLLTCTLNTQTKNKSGDRVWYIEVNGPSHYFVGLDFDKLDATRVKEYKLGATRVKEHHLALLNYKVVTIPFWEWDKIDYRCALVCVHLRQCFWSCSCAFLLFLSSVSKLT